MTAQELIKHLKTFPPKTPVKIWRWTGNGSIVGSCFEGCNVARQRELGVITLSATEGTEEEE